MKCDFCKSSEATVKIVSTEIATETVLGTRVYCAECGHNLVLDCDTGEIQRKPYDPELTRMQVAESEAAIRRGRHT